MRSIRRAICLAIAGLFLTSGMWSCQSPKTAERGSEDQVQGANYPDYEIDEYLVGEDVGFILKARAGDWDRIRPFLADLFAPAGGEGPGASMNERRRALSEAAQTGFTAFASEWAGYDLTLEHLDEERAAYLVFEPGRHSPSQACLLAGLPCVLFDNPGPRYGRLILPAKEPGKLAEELEERLGDAAYRMVELEYHVRVEFATASEPTEEVEEVLARRVADRPVDDHYGRQSPARQRVLSEATSFGMYVDLRSAVDAARYFEQWRMLDRLQETPEGERMRRVLAETASLEYMARLDMSERAEVEDVALVFDGDGESYALDAYYTKTKKGIEMAERAALDVELPTLQFEPSALEAEWSLRLDEIVGPSNRATWAERTPEHTTVGRNNLFRERSFLGVLRAPSAVTSTFVQRLQEERGLVDLTSVVSGRVGLAPPEGAPEDGEVPLAALRGGAVLLLAPGPGRESLVQTVESYADRVGELRVDSVERENDFLELRVAFRSELEDVFGEEPPYQSVGSLKFAASPSLTDQLAGVFRASFANTFGSSSIETLSNLWNHGPIHLDRAAGEKWVSFRLAFGGSNGAAPGFETVDYKAKQPKRRCMDRAGDKVRELLGDALEAEAPDAYLAERFSDDIGVFRNAYSDCGGQGEAESERSEWAKDYLDAWYALTLYRSGSKNWSKRLLEVCEEDHEWACGPKEGEWPWIRQ